MGICTDEDKSQCYHLRLSEGVFLLVGSAMFGATFKMVTCVGLTFYFGTLTDDNLKINSLCLLSFCCRLIYWWIVSVQGSFSCVGFNHIGFFVNLIGWVFLHSCGGFFLYNALV